MKNLFAVSSMLLCLALTSYAGPGRPSFSSRPSFSGGFRSSSSSSYRSFSSSPSRTFSFRSSPSTYSRPAAPRSYTYTVPKATIATPVSRSTVKHTTVVNNHYHGDDGHGSGGSGFGLGDALMFHALTSHNNSPTYVNAQPVVAAPGYVSTQPAAVVAPDYQDGPAVLYQREESHFWRNAFLIILGLGFCYGVYLFWKKLVAEYHKSV
jgi:hypothetical protein